jgi:hypothetical protein
MKSLIGLSANAGGRCASKRPKRNLPGGIVKLSTTDCMLGYTGVGRDRMGALCGSRSGSSAPAGASASPPLWRWHASCWWRCGNTSRLALSLKEPCSKTLDLTRSEIRNPPRPDQSWSIQVDEPFAPMASNAVF